MFAALDDRFFSLPRPLPVLLLLLLFGGIAWAALKTRHLTPSGAAAAVIAGLCVTLPLGFGGLFLLLCFYVSSNLLGKLRKHLQKADTAFAEKKGSCRDWVQVAANGLPAAVAAVLWGMTFHTLPAVLFGAALAEATSDTWAGEVGRLSHRAPVSLRTGKPVVQGVSGGVTLLGTAASLAASLLIALLWALCFPGAFSLSGVLVITAAGFLGCLADSLLGAFVQALYWDEDAQKYSEKPLSADGRSLPLVQGVRWIDNDAVNFLSNLIAVLLAWILYTIVR